MCFCCHLLCWLYSFHLFISSSPTSPPHTIDFPYRTNERSERIYASCDFSTVYYLPTYLSNFISLNLTYLSFHFLVYTFTS